MKIENAQRSVTWTHSTFHSFSGKANGPFDSAVSTIAFATSPSVTSVQIDCETNTIFDPERNSNYTSANCRIFPPRMDPLALVNPHLPRSDLLVLQNLLDDIERSESQTLPDSKIDEDLGYHSLSSSSEDLNELDESRVSGTLACSLCCDHSLVLAALLTSNRSTQDSHLGS